MNPARAFEQALALMHAGAWDEAWPRLERLLAAAPGQAELHYLLLQALLLAGRPAQALAHVEGAMTRLSPSAALSYWQGMVLEACGREAEALAAYAGALAQDPGHADSRLQRARLLLSSAPEAALAEYRSLVEAGLTSPELLQEYAEALATAGQELAAAACWFRLVRAQPEQTDWRARWLYWQARSAPQALPEQSAGLMAARPDLGPALALLAAAALRKVAQPALARELLAQALPRLELALRPLYELHQALQFFPIPAAAAEIEAYARHAAEALAAVAPASLVPLRERASGFPAALQLWEPLAWLPYLNLDPLPYRRAWGERFAALLPALPPVPPTQRARPAICFVLNSNSAVRAFLSGVFAAWPPGLADVTLAYTAPANLRPELEALHPDFAQLELAAAPEQALAQLRGFDLIFYTEVHTDRLAQAYWASHRLAPVQVTSWLSSGTSGLATMDYFLSSKLLEQGPDAQRFYSERLILLDEIPTLIEAPSLPPARCRADFGLPAAARLYLCAHLIFKLHPDFDAVLAGLLGRDPEALVLLQERPQDPWLKARLETRLRAACGEDYARIVWLPPMSHGEYLALLGLADLMLDPFYFGGGTTSFEALGLGLPIVTWPGERLHGRITAAYYRQLGLDDAIAVSPADYLERALALGMDAGRNQALRTRLRALAPELFGRRAAVRELAETLLALIAKA